MPEKNRRTSKSAKGSKSTGADHDLSAFNEDALSALTAKIENDLLKSKSQKSLATNPTTSETQATKSSKGKKRDSRGNIKSSTRKDERFEATQPSKAKDAGNDRDVLLENILALGGTEEDLDLIGDIESGSEDLDTDALQETQYVDGFSSKEVSKYITELGLNGQSEPKTNDSEEEIPDDSNHIDMSKEKTAQTPMQVELEMTTSANAEKSPKSSSHLIFEARPDWHAATLPILPSFDSSKGVVEALITGLKQTAYELLEQDSDNYNSKHLSSTSSQRFLSTIMSSGTLSDKVSALTLVVQESPVHTRKSFESLLSLAKKHSRGQAVSALGALKDLLGAGVVLPADRRLHSFGTQPGLLGTLQSLPPNTLYRKNELPGAITKGHLVSWAYEDWLKETYFDMLKLLEGWCNDEISFARGRALNYVFELLRDKPEQEANLLRLLVNKLGDPEKKIASRASYLILQLQNSHPVMKDVIIHTMNAELLLRPGQSSHAKYYAINTLNQTILSTNEEQLARKLLDIYFDLFVTILKKSTAKAPPSGPVFNKKGEIQGGGGAKGKMAKEKAAKEELRKQGSEELTEKMISAVLTGVNRAYPFAKSGEFLLENHMDTLFKITHSSNFNTSIQSLLLIQQISSSKHLAVDRFYRTLYESLVDSRLVTSSKHAMYLNLLFRALKSDMDLKRVKAFAKRLLQVLTLHEPPFICASLYLIRELEVTYPGLSSLLSEPEAGDDLEEEVFRDVPDTPMVDSSEGSNEVQSSGNSSNSTAYDGRKRDPEHSNADRSCLWELLPFLAHFHPSVSLFANRLLEGTEMPPKPDLTSHTLMSFLDRFVYRNAKTTTGGLKGSSIMQPFAGVDNSGAMFSNKAAHSNFEVLNSEGFWQRKAEDVPVDKVFFHKYFSQIGKTKAASKKPAKQKASEGHGSEDDAENEDEIWKALVESRPEVEGDIDEDDDIDLLDLEDEEDFSDGLDELDQDLDSQRSEQEIFDDMEVMDDSELNEASEGSDGGIRLDAGKAPLSAVKGHKSKKMKLKNLPTFASVEDYAEMMEDDEDEDL